MTRIVVKPINMNQQIASIAIANSLRLTQVDYLEWIVNSIEEDDMIKELFQSNIDFDIKKEN